MKLVLSTALSCAVLSGFWYMGEIAVERFKMVDKLYHSAVICVNSKTNKGVPRKLINMDAEKGTCSIKPNSRGF